LIIDEVGFNEISPLESKLFFQLIDMRYTKRSTIFISNITFDKWSQSVTVVCLVTGISRLPSK